MVAVVRAAAAAKKRVRVVGAGHSWNDIACTGESMMNLDLLCGVLAVDREARQITVAAGIRLRELNERVAEHGLALSNLGSIAEQSLAGAISTGTHGSGIRFGNLATQVVALRLVTADGTVRDLSAEHDPELFAAARVGLGALGVITAVTVQCEEAFHLEERAFALPFDRAVASLDELIDGHEHMKLWWLPHTDEVQVYCYNRTKAQKTPRSRIARWFEEGPLVLAAFALLLAWGRIWPRAIPAINRFVKSIYFKPRERVDRSDRILNIPMPPMHRESEYAIGREQAGEALSALRALIDGSDGGEPLHVNFVVELRFVAGDDGMLSPAHGRASCQIGAYMHAGRSLDRYFEGFERLMLARGGRPHWGKEFRAGGDVLRPRYPRFDRFAALRRELDPNGMFENDYIRRLFGPSGPV